MNEINDCEVCGSRKLDPVLDLGPHPMCDDLVPVGDERVCCEYPIEILYCDTCHTAHQRFQIPKKLLFPKAYHYRSRFTADVLNGMRGLVESVAEQFGSLEGKLVLDVGCNDGSLLGFFRDAGCTTVGIEPTDAALDAREAGHPVYDEYLSVPLGEKLVQEHGRPDFIVFTNVFAHIENLGEVLDSLRSLLKEETVLVIENHYLGEVLSNHQFDTFYHEHPRTYSATSFSHIAASLGLPLSNIGFPARYGGNIRMMMGGEGRAPQEELTAALDRETDFPERFAAMAKGIERWRESKGGRIRDMVAKHGPLRAKAFPGRAAILVKLLGLDVSDIACVHEKPGSMKIGHYVPGTRIPIVSDEDFSVEAYSAPLLNLAWHISSEIQTYMRQRGFKGEIIDILEPSDVGA